MNRAAARTRSNRADLQVVGPIFMPELYGIAIAAGNPMRKRINEALLEIYEDGTYDAIYDRWCARSR